MIFTLAGSCGLALEAILCERHQQQKQQKQWQQNLQQEEEGEEAANQSHQVFVGEHNQPSEPANGVFKIDSPDSSRMSGQSASLVGHAEAIRTITLVGLLVAFSVIVLIPPDTDPPIQSKPTAISRIPCSPSSVRPPLR